MNKYAIANLAGYSFVTILSLMAAGGWIANIYKLLHYYGSVLDMEAVIRIVGIFVAPLGVVMGYL